MEKIGGEAYETCLDFVLNSVGKLLDDMQSTGMYRRYQHLKSSMERMRLELTSLKMFFWGLAFWEDLEYDWHLLFAINSMLPVFSQLAREFKADTKRAQDQNQRMNLEEIIYNLEEAIRRFKPQVKDICIHILGGAFKCTSCLSDRNEFLEYARETASFIDFIQQNLWALRNSNLVAPGMKQHIALIHGKLEELGPYADPVTLSITKVKKLYGLISHARTWCNHISCLTYLYLVEGETSSMETVSFGIPFSTSGIISFYSQPTIIPQLLARHYDFLLQDLVMPMAIDLSEGLIFMLSFIMDQPQDDSGDSEMICTQIYSIINEIPYLIHSMKEGICNVNFSDFMLKVDRLKNEVKKLYVVTPYSSHCCSPGANVIGFLDFMITSLREMLHENVNLIPSLRHQGELLQEEILLLKPVVRNFIELLQDKHGEIRHLWTSVISAIYNADYFIKLCYPRPFYLWYGMIGLPDVIEDIKSIKIEIIKMVGVDKTCNKKKIPHHQIEETERNFIGFMEDQKVIIDELRRGQKSLTIISISGAGGQGKTTFAKRICNDSNVQYHFQKIVWCYVSKDCPVKEILGQILSCDTNGSGGADELGMNDLVMRVRRSLKGRRYLVVMDDIWDSDGWQKLESSFPDDKNGSRILLTSRNHDLALQAKPNSIPHPLPLLSDEESWELMKKIFFGSHTCDEEFVGIGKKIASYCKGLPLAVVLIAAVLRRTEQYLNSWNKVAENLKAYLAEEGCGNVIELSYRYLPDHLKSCFLYFGAFPRGENVIAKDLELLWIGEGFIFPDGETKSSKRDLASDYLEDLASQSLVVVSERSSMGGIKRCNLHDLLYDLCLERCKEDSFLTWVEASSILGDNKVHKYNHHRLRIGASDPFTKSSPVVTRRELPTSPLHSFLWFSNEGSDSSFPFIKSFKILTVLSLRLNVDKFPQVILSSIHLRYLALYFRRSIRVVPPEITNMCMLETLIIDCHFYHECTQLPTCMWNMKSLRHVDVKDADLNLKGCDNLFGGASNVETLGVIRLNGDESTTAEFLRRFPNLRKLSCGITAQGNILKLLSMVGSLLTKLESLKICYNNGLLYVKASNPITCNFAKIENLNKLSLGATRIQWSVLSEIGKQLPNLQVLKLPQKSCLGRSWEVKDGVFSKLMYLKLKGLDIKEIDVSNCDDNPFPCLEHLVLQQCYSLKEIPSVFEEISTLKAIKVSRCRKEVEDSAMAILEQQRDYGNPSFQVMVERTYVDCKSEAFK